MEEINQTPPDRLTADQRCAEVALYMARALARLRTTPITMSGEPDVESTFDLPSSVTRAFMTTRHQRKMEST